MREARKQSFDHLITFKNHDILAFLQQPIGSCVHQRCVEMTDPGVLHRTFSHQAPHIWKNLLKGQSSKIFLKGPLETPESEISTYSNVLDSSASLPFSVTRFFSAAAKKTCLFLKEGFMDWLVMVIVCKYLSIPLSVSNLSSLKRGFGVGKKFYLVAKHSPKNMYVVVDILEIYL